MNRSNEAESGANRPEVPAFCVIDVKLEWCQPPITRRLLVPTSAHLGWLHAVLQVAMGWEDDHLHSFRADKIRMGCPAQDPEEFTYGSTVDENTVTLAECLASGVKRLEYMYDFGDSWNHRLTLKRATKAMIPFEKHAVCLAGERACPPEDSGGPPGYEMLVAALQDPKHPEHEARREWMGRPFDPESFSVDKTNRFLAKLPWPDVSRAALGKILRARDKSAN